LREGVDVQVLAQDIDMPLGDGESVLVVEDDHLVREVAMQRLEALGYIVSEASNTQAALAHIASGAPVDLVFSDIILPSGPSGLDLSAILRRDHPRIAVLLTSGHASAAYRGKTEATAVPDILAKPYSMRELAFAVRRRLAVPR
jgi:CheY-like chemotaxis protein